MKKIRTVGCFLEYKDTFLILFRNKNKPYGHTWCLPSGKVEESETDIQAMLRELKEETGYNASKEELDFLIEFSHEVDDTKIIFPTFRIQLKESISIKHNLQEHDTYKWVTAQECYNLSNLIPGFCDLLKEIGYIKK